MKELTLDPVSLCPELERPGRYRCSVLVDEIKEEEDQAACFCESYGLRVASAEEPGDCVCISHITVSPARIMELARLVIRNEVGPVHLRDVVDDWL